MVSCFKIAAAVLLLVTQLVTSHPLVGRQLFDAACNECGDDAACLACLEAYTDAAVDKTQEEAALQDIAALDCDQLLGILQEGYPAECNLLAPDTPLYASAACIVDAGVSEIFKQPDLRPCGTPVGEGDTAAPTMAPSTAPTMAPAMHM